MKFRITWTLINPNMPDQEITAPNKGQPLIAPDLREALHILAEVTPEKLGGIGALVVVGVALKEEK